MNTVIREKWNSVSPDQVAVHQQHDHPFANPVGILDRDPVIHATEAADDGIFLPLLRDAGINHEAVIVGLDAEDIVRDRRPVPRSGSREP